MELRQLRYFLAVVEERQFARAATRLHIAAPSLSQQIRVLERELGVTLLDRSPRRVDVTPAGDVLVSRARVILAEAARAEDEVRTARNGQRDQLVLRVCTMAELVLGGLLRATTHGVAGVEVTIASSPGDDAIEAVRQGRADAAVVWERSARQHDVQGATLGSVPFGVALPKEHPLLAVGRVPVGRVPVSRLIHEHVVMFPRSPFAGVWDRVVGHLLPVGHEAVQVVVEPDLVHCPAAMLRAVAAGAGIAPAIVGVAEHVGVAGIEIRPLDPELSLNLEVVWRVAASPALGRLVDFLVDGAAHPSGVLQPG
jgi:DNA-binding transcriptional LysR family regulator